MFASSWSLTFFLVGYDVERDKEKEVGGEYSHASESCEFLSSAFACIRYPRPVGRSEVGVGREVDEAWERIELEVGRWRGKGREKERVNTEVNNKLHNLKSGDPLLPPDLDATRALEVVPVHEDVNHKVECNRDP